jgi:hypothetical protein
LVRDLQEQHRVAHQERDRLLENALAASAAIADIVHAAYQEVPPMAMPEPSNPDREDGAFEPHQSISEAANYIG